jgi:hypothetical protein
MLICVWNWCKKNQLRNRHLNWMKLHLWRGLLMYVVVSFPPATEETGAMGREIESHQGIGWQIIKNGIHIIIHRSDEDQKWYFLKLAQKKWNYQRLTHWIQCSTYYVHRYVFVHMYVTYVHVSLSPGKGRSCRPSCCWQGGWRWSCSGQTEFCVIKSGKIHSPSVNSLQEK